MMYMFKRWLTAFSLLLVIFLLNPGTAQTAELLIAYGGHNETMAPIWVGIDKGLFRKHGVDPRAANPQRTDHDGHARLRWHAARMGSPR